MPRKALYKLPMTQKDPALLCDIVSVLLDAKNVHRFCGKDISNLEKGHFLER